MLPDLTTGSTLPVLEKVVQFTQARHGVLAGNLANVNTPGYQSRDLSTTAFEESLRDSLAESRKPRSPGDGVLLGPLAEGAGLVAGKPGGGPLGQGGLPGVEPTERLIYHDGRDVSLEEQITKISKNQAQHNLAIALMTTQFRQLRAAISETVA